MHESVLRQFLDGLTTPEVLFANLQGTLEREGPADTTTIHYHVVFMPEAFEVTSAHILRLLEAVIDQSLPVSALDPIGICLELSENFYWENNQPAGERLDEAIFLLTNPDINYPLTPAVLEKIRHYLLTGEDLLSRSDWAK